MSFQTSTDAFKVYRGTEEKIRNTRDNPIRNGHIYFAYDSDKLFYDADNSRHEISGGGNVVFIQATSQPEFEGDTGLYVFNRSDINSDKLAIDNIILASNDALYRVIEILDADGKVKTKQIAGGGGGGGGVVDNPITITTIQSLPSRTIDTQDVTCIIKVNSRITTDETCMLQVFINDVEITDLGAVDAPLRTELEFEILHQYYDVTKVNEVKFVATIDENVKTKSLFFYPFHSEFTITDFNYRTPYGTDSAVTQTMSINYGFTGLNSPIYGHIRMFIDGDEAWDLTNSSDPDVLQAGGGAIRSTMGALTIPLTRTEFAYLEHGNYTFTFRAYAVVNEVEYFVDEVSYDIIWATEEGGNAPIIISSYPAESTEENYNIINIPYLIYAKNTESFQLHLYINNEELPTSPITYTDKGYTTWQFWTISKYVPNYTNSFLMVAIANEKTAAREFSVKIEQSQLPLDAVSDGLLLHLSAQDRSNKESALSRQTWTYTSAISGQTVAAQFANFNWYNNGWQLDDNGDNVLRLNNGATVTIPFDQVLQQQMPDNGFTIETEFRCRNATSFAKLLTYSAKDTDMTDEYGNIVYETETLIDEETGEPIMQVKMKLDDHGNKTDIPLQEVDARGHLAFDCITGIDEETGEDIHTTLYEHEDDQGVKTYWTKKNVEFTDTIYSMTPIYQMEEVIVNRKRDPEGPYDASNWIPKKVEAGAVVKNINYVRNELGEETGQVANAVGTFFGKKHGLCIGTQEAFFASKEVTVNVRYADNDKVKISVVADTTAGLLYIYINAVLSGVERFSKQDDFSTGALGMVFNSDYCDLDLYTIRIYNKALNFAEIVQNWVGDASNLADKRQRYQENSITMIDENRYVTLDYDKTKKLSKDMAENYKKQVALGNTDAQKGLPIAVISTYPIALSKDSKSDLLPYNKAIKQYVDIRFWDPNYDPEADNPALTGIPGFKVQDFELSVQGTSSQGYPRRNFKAKLKETDSSKNAYAKAFPFYWTTWDGNDDLKDEWPKFNFPEPLEADATEQQQAAYETAYERALETGWNEYKTRTQVVDGDHVTEGYKEMKKIDIGNGTNESNFCFKADYMDSSSAHNTSLANYIAALCTYNPKLAYPPTKFAANPGAWRQTVYGTPMLVFWDHKRQTTKPEFVGRYNFNTDKSATGSFGFTVKDKHKFLSGIDYYAKVKYIKDGKEKEKIDIVHGDPTYKDICECWELTSNQHGFTGFRRNDFDALNKDGKLDFYDFWENRYHGTEFDIDDVYDESKDFTATNLMLGQNGIAKNIIDLSKWIYSTDIHPWDGEGEANYDPYDITHHKLSAIADANEIKYRIISETDEEVTNFELLRDYYTVSGTKVTPITKDQFVITKQIIDETPTYTITIYAKQDDQLTDTVIPASLLSVDEINATLDTPAFFITRDEEPDVEWTGEQHNTRVVHKAYYYAANEQSLIPDSWYKRVEILAKNKVWVLQNPNLPESEDNPGHYEETNEYTVVGYATKIVDDETDSLHPHTYTMDQVYEEYTKDNKAYRLAKYRSEFDQHLNFAYCALYFILTEFFILYDSREKNMMIATWGPEEVGGNYIWYPIFYDMDTQLGINNSGTVYWDYDENAQDNGVFSGAGSVLWDNFYACFLDEIKAFYRTMRSSGHFNLEGCEQYYNTESADRWTPIMKNIDAFYKYIAPSIDAPGLRYITKQGDEAITSSFFYCAQGDRTLNRSAFFRNRFNYKDSEWLGGSYQTQGGKNIEMRYDANWTGTSDPNASDWEGDTAAQAARADLESNATFDIKPYLTQYCSVYYDELPREGGRYDIQHEPAVDNQGHPTPLTALYYPKNLDHIKKTGYVTVDPLPAIQDKIDEGAALSQQLVYIYGPEYIRDLGDLSLKYLDRFFCGDAIRINRLILGNDHPLYKNDGMAGAFSLDTAYYSSFTDANGNRALNPNAKALLEYIDLSNLGGLAGGLDLSGCLKLNTLKARGTNYTSITIPEGNVIETLYLPASTESFVQIQSQKLNKVIRTANLASAYEQAKLGQTQAVGLFIEKITDRMNCCRAADSGIYDVYTSAGTEDAHRTAMTPYIENDLYYNQQDHTKSDYMTNIDTYSIEGGKLGFISYEMLDYIIKQKIKARYDTAINNTKPQLRLRLLDVAWTPYEKIDELAEDDRLYSDNKYFVRTDDLTYIPLDSNTTFEYANKNLGGIYRKTDNRLRKNGINNEDTMEGIPDLKMLQMFISDKNNAGRTNTNANNYYLVRDTYIPNDLSKRLPLIGGEIYVDNEESINEYTLYEIAQTFTEALTTTNPDFTPLTICAKNVTPCPRSKFVEIMPDGTQRFINMYRSSNPNDLTPIPSNLVRNDYDFRGWISDEDLGTNNDFLKIVDGVVQSTTGGVVETNSPLLEQLSIIVDQKTGEKTFKNNEPLTFGSTATTYYAVYTLHKYEVKYILDIVAYNIDNTDETSFENVYIPSNDYVDSLEPEHIPYVKNDTSPIGKLYKFMGWAADENQATQQKLFNRHVRIRKNMVLYPCYQQVNAYAKDSALPENTFYYVILNGKAILYGTKRHLGGRITIPKTLGGAPVETIWGSPIDQNTDEFLERVINGTSVRSRLEGNGFQRNNDIEHIYFEGANNGTSSVTTYNTGAFIEMRGLTYIDFPDTLTTVGANCFQKCSKLTFSDLNNVTSIGMAAFQYCNTSNQEGSLAEILNGQGQYSSDHETKLYINPNAMIVAYAFSGCGWQEIEIGSEEHPASRRFPNNIDSSQPYAYFLDQEESVWLPDEMGLQKITLYSSIEGPDSYASGDALTSKKRSQGGNVDIVVITVA